MQPKHLDFLSKGLACHALCLLEYAGVLDILMINGTINEKELNSFKNPSLIRSALVTLTSAEAISFNKNSYHLTPLGRNLGRNIGAIFLPLVGYRHLFAKQFELIDDPSGWEASDIDFNSVAASSIDFGQNDLDPTVLQVIQQIKPKGTICDLGCGTAEKLAGICEELNIKGLGIERDPVVIQASRKFTNGNPSVEVVQADITNLNGIWEDVNVAIMNMVFHDITPSSSCVEFLQSLRTHFPRLQRLLVADMVSMSEDSPSIMPGFDYVHGLQGMTPRNYQETMQTFVDAGYSVINETTVPNMPNTFVWVVSPH